MTTEPATDPVEAAFLRWDEVRARHDRSRRTALAGAAAALVGAAVVAAGWGSAGAVLAVAGALALGVGLGGRHELARLQRLRLGPGVDVAPFEQPPFRPGHPVPCPRCGSPGYLERIESRNQRQWHRCRRCEHRWSVRIPARPR